MTLLKKEHESFPNSKRQVLKTDAEYDLGAAIEWQYLNDKTASVRDSVKDSFSWLVPKWKKKEDLPAPPKRGAAAGGAAAGAAAAGGYPLSLDFSLPADLDNETMRDYVAYMLEKTKLESDGARVHELPYAKMLSMFGSPGYMIIRRNEHGEIARDDIYVAIGPYNGMLKHIRHEGGARHVYLFEGRPHDERLDAELLTMEPFMVQESRREADRFIAALRH